MINHRITEGLSTVAEKLIKTPTVPYLTAGLDYLISTPVIMAMIIDTSVKLLDPLLPPGFITVGNHVELTHEKPTLYGEKITLVLTVTKISGGAIILEFTIHDASGQVCKGYYERQIVATDKLMEIANRRAHRSM